MIISYDYLPLKPSEQNNPIEICLDHGMLIDTHPTDNGVFKANKFIQHTRQPA